MEDNAYQISRYSIVLLFGIQLQTTMYLVNQINQYY